MLCTDIMTTSFIPLILIKYLIYFTSVFTGVTNYDVEYNLLCKRNRVQLTVKFLEYPI